MIKVKIFRNNKNNIYGFNVSGHAGFAKSGKDIVCSAVSILVVNTINCIELFTNEGFDCDADEKNGGFISYSLKDVKNGEYCHDADLLLKAMLNGLKEIKEEYSCYIDIYDEEVY